MTNLLMLMGEFLLTGMFAIGGGLATLPFLTNMGLRHPTWFTHEMLVNMIAVSESTPGPIGINMATYVGYTVAGVPGAVLATLSLVFPSVVVILVIARVLQKYKDSLYVNTAFSALRPVVTGLIASAAYSILLLVLFPGAAGAFSWLNAGIFVALFALTQIKWTKSLHPILFIVAGAVLGILLKLE